MFKRYCVAFCLLLGLTATSFAREFIAEVWQDLAYRRTNYANTTPEPVENFLFFTLALKPGFRLKYIPAEAPNRWLYVDFLVDGTLVQDLLLARANHANLYNNHYKLGFTVKGGYRDRLLLPGLLDYLNLEALSRVLWLNTYNPEVESWLQDIHTQDTLVALRLLLEGRPHKYLAWKWETNLEYHSTNFGNLAGEHYLVLVGLPWFMFTPPVLTLYLRGEFLKDFFTFSAQNRNPYSNNIKAIFGVERVFSWQQLLHLSSVHPLSRLSLNLYGEFSLIYFLNDPSSWPFAAKLAPLDFKAGFSLSWNTGNVY